VLGIFNAKYEIRNTRERDVGCTKCEGRRQKKHPGIADRTLYPECSTHENDEIRMKREGRIEEEEERGKLLLPLHMAQCIDNTFPANCHRACANVHGVANGLRLDKLRCCVVDVSQWWEHSCTRYRK
jgi:hypothetical protein